MKSFKFYILAPLALIIIVAIVFSCKKDKKDGGEDPIIENANGTIEIPSTIIYSNIEIVSGTNKSPINEQGEFNIETQGIVYAINKQTNEIIYFSILPAADKTISKSANTEQGIVLSPMETATSLVYLASAATGFRPDLFVDATQTFLAFKEYISTKETTQVLAEGILENIEEYGELYFVQLEDALLIDAVDEVIDCSQDIYDALGEQEELILAYQGEENQFSIFAPYLEYNTLSVYGDFKVEIDNAIWKSDEGMWELECTIYSGSPQYFAATSGYINEATNTVIYDKTQIGNLVLPYNTSSFYNDVSSCNGFAKFITDTRNILSYGFEGLHYSTRQFTQSKIKVKVNNENDLIVLFNPQASNHLKTLVILQLGLNLTKNTIGMFSAFTNTLEDGQSSDEKKSLIVEMLSEFIEEVLTDPQMQAYIHDGVFKPTKENYREITNLLMEKFFNYLKDNKSKFNDLVDANDLSDQIDLDELIAHEYALTKKLIDKIAKFSASTLDIFMAVSDWDYAYNGFYFQLNFNEYFELMPLPGTENANLSTENPSIIFSDEIDINANFNCTVKGYGPAPYESTEIFALLPENVSYITNLGKVVGISFDKTEFKDDWEYEIRIETGAIVDKNGVAFPGVGEGAWSFHVTNSGGGDFFTDPRDGQSYATVDIGSQTWFAENLNFETTNSWTYDDDPANGDIYGRLYTWETALTACPAGWHLPSDEEWKILEMALGMSQSEAGATGYRGTNEGEKMKSTSGWTNNGNGTNTSGFNAFPGGNRYRNGSFNYLGSNGYWWSNTEGSGLNAWHRSLDSDSRVYRNNSIMDGGSSVRCLKN